MFKKLLFVALTLLTFNVLAYPNSLERNNPGNIVKTAITWKGEVDCDSKFECFESPYWGLRAMTKNVMAYYYTRDLHTIREIITRWAPPHENDTDMYVELVSYKLKIHPDEHFELSHHLYPLVEAIIIMENGYNPYDIEFLSGVLYDTFRTSNSVYLDNSRSSIESMGTKNAGAAGREQGLANELSNGSAGEREHSQQLQYRNAMDSPSYRFDLGYYHNSITTLGSCTKSRNNSMAWLDGDKTRIPIPAGQGSIALAHDRRDGPDPSPYPFSIFDNRLLFRREYCWI